MKIVHIAPNAPYNIGWGYQENLLPKYQRKLGHEVTLLITDTMHRDGQIVKTECEDIRLEDGVRVIRLPRKRCLNRRWTNLYAKMEVYPLLRELAPDLIMFHGMISGTIYDVVRYKKENPACVVIQDNHLDYNIGRRFKTVKEKLCRSFYRYMQCRSIHCVTKVYGVTPWRKQYAEDYFKAPPEKTDVLIMGADDDKIDFANREAIRQQIRQKYEISDRDFLVVTGGKIDRKKNIHLLMNACSGMENVKLLVFGQVSADLEAEFQEILQASANVVFVGWVDADAVYDYFFAADLVCFPGQHSVLWEQACAAKVPCVFKYYEGMDHVNNGGNSDFVDPVTEETLRDTVLQLKLTPRYYNMKRAAESALTDIYLYSHIAEKSLECVTREGTADT